MIARLWHGAVPVEKAESYYEYLLRTGVADYLATAGNRGVLVLRHADRELTHYQLLTLWESDDAIRAFAGEEYGRARYYPEDAEYLVELEPFVRHYEVVTFREPGESGSDEVRS